MFNMLKMFLTVLLLSTSILAYATQDVYPFEQAQQNLRFHRLLKNLRCLVCQNEDLADSNAGLAQDLRGEIYDMVRRGESDRQIKKYLTERYGDFVLFQPPLKAETYLLWFGPFLLLICALLILLRKIVYKREQV
jgi:cytochrome c-type biogenesis protein CcmH